MKRISHTVALVLLLVLTVPVGAREMTVDPTSLFTFSADDFTSEAADEGVFLTSVPLDTTVWYGTRQVRAGDALPRAALDQLTLEADCFTAQEVSIGYMTLNQNGYTGAKELKLSIMPKKNEPPTVEDGSLETYRNIPNQGTFAASDPEGGVLTYTIKTEPKRGTVELHEDGTFTYTPSKNKVGKDSFTFAAVDEAGNSSEAGKISIVIKKPTDKATYADLDSHAFQAMWMKEQGLFTGTKIGGHLCFEPDAAVSRGEFLVMAMKLVDAKADEAMETSGFADEADTPMWLRPYVVSALRSGMISGDQSEAGVVFRPAAELNKAEAAVMLQNILQLPASDAAAVFGAETTVPVWAQRSVAALSAAGVHLDAGTEPLTRLDAAELFYQVSKLLDAEAMETFYWIE